MGVNMDGTAWVRHGGMTYRVKLGEDGRTDDVEVESGPDQPTLDHIRSCALDAFIDAYGAQ